MVAVNEEHAQLTRESSGLRRVAFSEDSNRVHYTFPSYLYDRSYSQPLELQAQPMFDAMAMMGM